MGRQFQSLFIVHVPRQNSGYHMSNSGDSKLAWEFRHLNFTNQRWRKKPPRTVPFGRPDLLQLGISLHTKESSDLAKIVYFSFHKGIIGRWSDTLQHQNVNTQIKCRMEELCQATRTCICWAFPIPQEGEGLAAEPTSHRVWALRLLPNAANCGFLSNITKYHGHIWDSGKKLDHFLVVINRNRSLETTGEDSLGKTPKPATHVNDWHQAFPSHFLVPQNTAWRIQGNSRYRKLWNQGGIEHRVPVKSRIHEAWKVKLLLGREYFHHMSIVVIVKDLHLTYQMDICTLVQLTPLHGIRSCHGFPTEQTYPSSATPHRTPGRFGQHGCSKPPTSFFMKYMIYLL